MTTTTTTLVTNVQNPPSNKMQNKEIKGHFKMSKMEKENKNVFPLGYWILLGSRKLKNIMHTLSVHPEAVSIHDGVINGGFIFVILVGFCLIF